jgi:signal transduction histidine kinase
MTANRATDALQRHPWAADLLLVAALAGFTALTGIVLVAPEVLAPPSAPRIVAVAVALAAPLALRRRFPIGALIATLVQLPFYWGFGQDNEIGAWTALGIAVYSAAAYGRRPLAGRVCAALLGALIVLVIATAPDLESPIRVAAGVLFLSVPFGLAWPMGSIVRALRETREQLQASNLQLAAEREAGARRAVLEERVRIARELHDVVAHYVSLMSVQAGVARRLFRSRPEQALEAIGEVEVAGRQAVSDLQQLLGVLRSDEPDPGPAPQPGLGQLPDLIEHTRRAGLAIDLRIDGERRELPAAVELSLYRVAQEALTNTLKHAAASRADVRLHYRPGSVELEVLDDGRGAAQGPNGSGPVVSRNGGRGLVGMHERIGLHGGRLDVGPAPSGGFRVHAVVEA